MKKRLMLATAVMAAVVPGLGLAQFAKPGDAVHYRKAVMTVMGTHFGRINQVVRGDRPFDAADVQKNANLVAMMGQLPWQAFEVNNTSGSDALPAVWSDAAKFKAARDEFEKTLPALQAAAKSGDAAQLKTAFGATGKACKGCHDDFRKR